MKVVTYLGFTVLSIFIQFCVMDFIQEKIQVTESPAGDNVTDRKKIVDDLLKNITSKPHALYYRTLKRPKAALGSVSERFYDNSSVLITSLGTTDMSTTIFDILYDENTSVTETTSTTESLFTTTEFDNVTEITFFDPKNKSIVPQNTVPKTSFSKYCGCNLLFKVCDIDCCCDVDCTKDEQTHFQCEKKNNYNRVYYDGCISHLLDGDLRYGISNFDSLFCVVKTNLPDKKNVQKPNLANLGQYNKWKNIPKGQTLYNFSKTMYKQADPIWLLKNGTIYYLDFPISMINNYCTDRAPILFLKDEKILCNVKFNDLEMFHISRTSEESMVISATESSFNSSVLNCSNLHCVNWTILVCDKGICTNYNKSFNEASCTETSCINLALKIDYYFYYYDSKIINATIKLHIENITQVMPFMSQEITVKFVMANKSIDSVIEFSGNPGYITNLPIIVSRAKSNFTENFFNGREENIMRFPGNQNGICVGNSSQNVVRFGLNRRMKCRYIHAHKLSSNNTNMCNNIQDNINKLFGLNREISVSPFGNPFGFKDENWIRIQTNIDKQEPVYGDSLENMSKFHCFNLINRVAITFIFASVNENGFTGQNKILLAKYEVVPNNTSFTTITEEISIVVTIDINFVDVTNPNMYIYAGSPHLNIHLPKDFFFPFPPNNSFHVTSLYILTIFCYVSIFFANKITLE